MERYPFLLLFTLFFPTLVTAQSYSTVTGTITDAATGETLIGVNVVVNEGQGAASDIDGNYSMQVPTGNVKLKFSYIGYYDFEKEIDIAVGEEKRIDVALEQTSTQLDQVVVTAGKFEQKIGDVTVSMDVIKPELIENKNTTTIETALDQVPGCVVLDGQVSIRGGSGFAYGAGSRVLMMVDGMPLLAGDAQDVKWNSLPVENIEQVEVIKGASSVLFGSSALNGAINIRTGYPRAKPETKVNLFHGLYDSPMRLDSLGNPTDITKWWDGANPTFSGLNFYHSRKIKALDLVVGGALFTDQGYREGETENRGRLNFNTRYRNQKIKGLSYGLNGNAQYATGGLYLLWQNSEEGALRPNGGLHPDSTTISYYTSTRMNFDPYIEYWTSKGNKHSLRNRFYQTNNTNDTEQGSLANQWYSEYQYQKNIDARKLTLTSGAVFMKTNVQSELYGDHDGVNMAVFSQLDKKWGRLNLSLGVRAEYFRIDTFETESAVKLPIGSDSLELPVSPVFRAGANYQLFEETYLRSSFGQGYRFPTIAEKFVQTQVGPLTIFPNPNLQPETGWSAELGIKQGFKISNWAGYLDVAFFWTEYENMMEFVFDTRVPDTANIVFLGDYAQYAGFRSENVENARINGIDASIVGSGKLGKVNMTVLAGYTYMNPVSFNADSSYLANLTDTTSNMLKYRFNHLAKADIQFDYKKWSTGISFRYNSFMVNIDRSFYNLEIQTPLAALPLGDVILPGIEDYRNQNNSGDYIFDYRLSYQISNSSKIAVIVNNLLNREYMTRPGDIQPPRNFTIQYALKL